MPRRSTTQYGAKAIGTDVLNVIKARHLLKSQTQDFKDKMFALLLFFVLIFRKYSKKNKSTMYGKIIMKCGENRYITKNPDKRYLPYKIHKGKYK